MEQKWKHNKVTLLDGSMGTMLQKAGMKPGQIPEILNITNPEMTAAIYNAYIDAGSDILYANTFGASPLKLKTDMQASIQTAIQTARQCITNKGKEGRVSVALDVGPLGQLLEPMGTLTFDEAYDAFCQIMEAGKEADLIVIETQTCLLEAKAALLAAREKTNLPVLVSMTFEENGRTFTGTTPEIFAETMTALGADAIGINCSLGPDRLLAPVQTLLEHTHLPVAVKPNAGLPDPVTGTYNYDDETFADLIEQMLDMGVTMVGGCCGTTPDTIAAIQNRLKNRKEQTSKKGKTKETSSVTSSLKYVPIDRVRTIGERINPTGKKRLQQALKEKDMAYIVSLALEQEEAGADMLDINVGYPGVVERELLPEVVKAIQAVCSLPLVLDSSDPEALEAALRIYDGKPAINSTSAEQEKMDQILPLAKKYGAALIGLTIDEQGIPTTTQQRIENAKKIKAEAGKFGIDPKDLWIDCLTLTASAQPDQTKETLQAIGHIRKLGMQATLGVSNISFGLPNRPLINTVFLAQAMQAGLNVPILNPSSQPMMDAVKVHHLLHGQDEGARNYIEAMQDREEETKATAKVKNNKREEKENSGIDSLHQSIYKGLDKAAGKEARERLKETEPIQLIETVLVPALDKVGKEYEQGTMYLPQLLASAQAAQAVFEEIKTFLAQSGQEETKKGTIVMATVKGDIHDIGKNIVKTILENYGYHVIDLGKDVDPEVIVKKAKETGAPLVGLSALMTTTLPAMEQTAKLLQQMDNPPVVMVGGAVVTPAYAEKIGARYARDAMESAAIAKDVFGK